MTCVSNHLLAALRIQRTVPPRDWPAALEKLPDEARGDCDAYLRQVAQLMRMRRAAAVKLAMPNSTGKLRRRG